MSAPDWKRDEKGTPSSHLPPGLCQALGRLGHGCPALPLATLNCLSLCRWFCLVLIRLSVSFSTISEFLFLLVAQRDACMNADISQWPPKGQFISVLLRFVQGGMI